VKGLATALALLLAAGTAHADDPPWMPSRPAPMSLQREQRIKQLRHDSALFGLLGLVLFAAGVAVDVVALDVPQGEATVKLMDGTMLHEHVRNGANWAEFAAGTSLLAAALALTGVGLFRARQAARLERE
jgi:hypothetical protein